MRKKNPKDSWYHFVQDLIVLSHWYDEINLLNVDSFLFKYSSLNYLGHIHYRIILFCLFYFYNKLAQYYLLIVKIISGVGKIVYGHCICNIVSRKPMLLDVHKIKTHKLFKLIVLGLFQNYLSWKYPDSFFNLVLIF